jgi:hypothetical protein
LVSDECPLDVFGFLPLYIRSEHDGRSTSKIDQDPKKFGYIVESGKPWQGNDMNFQQALKLVHEIYSDERVLNKSKFSAATWIGRIMNLGYNVEDIFNMINDTSISANEINKKLTIESNSKKDWYFKELMKL